MQFVTCSEIKNESTKIRAAAYDAVAHFCDDELDYRSFVKLNEFSEYYRSHSLLDIACMDITASGALAVAEGLRSAHNETLLMLVADTSIMPNVYLKPSIMAASLLLRPIDDNQLHSAIGEVISALGSNKSAIESVFNLKTQEGTLRISYKDIYYFEAREKKVFVRTCYEEYSFYSTIEKLAEVLPEGFMRCHRSFIINSTRIRKISFSENLIYLDDGIALPLARSCRSAAREWK